jgi:hypothetical protein
MYDFAENLQERARLRHDRNVEAVGIFISPGAPMRLDYTRKKYAGEPAGSIGLPRDQPNPGRRAAPGQHVSPPYGHKPPGRELNWTENTTT